MPDEAREIERLRKQVAEQNEQARQADIEWRHAVDDFKVVVTQRLDSIDRKLFPIESFMADQKVRADKTWYMVAAVIVSWVPWIAKLWGVKG